MKNEFIIRYPLLLYPKRYIEQGINDYREICDITVQYDKDVAVCSISNSVGNLKITVQEFSNYLIELINARGNLC